MTAVAESQNIATEIIRCHASPVYFGYNYCKIKDEKSGDYHPYRPWPAQVEALKASTVHRLVVMLKARQIGMTTGVVCVRAVHLGLFKPGSTVLIFSKSRDEAKKLLKRIRTMIMGLPEWMQPAAFTVDASQELELSNGTLFVTFGSKASGGDSYTASLVIIDEADLIPDLDLLLSGAKPTIAAGGSLIMLSRVDKREPNSPFKRTFKAAQAGNSPYHPIFFPWHARPDRTQAWYDGERKEIEARTGAVDELYEQYPATPEEALAARMLDKRLPIIWLQQCFHEWNPINRARLPLPFSSWDRLEVYKLPEPGRKYLAGTDVAKGNPNSDDSVTTFIDRETLEEVAVLCGKLEPTVLAHHTAQLAKWYNDAPANIERNHHGHKCIDEARKKHGLTVLKGRDGKPGWWTDPLGKTTMYDNVADVVRLGACTIHSRATFEQLASIDVARMEAPEGFADDRAMSFALAVHGAGKPQKQLTAIQLLSGEATKPEAEQAISYAGVSFVPSFAEWQAVVVIQNERIDLGTYKTDREAAAAVNAAHLAVGQQAPNAVPTIEGQDAEVRARIKLRGFTVNTLPPSSG